MQDDFYLNLVDWSSNNVLAVGLGNCVYLWNACSSKVNSVVRMLIVLFERQIFFLQYLKFGMGMLVLSHLEYWFCFIHYEICFAGN